MRIVSVARSSLNGALSLHFRQTHLIRTLSTFSLPGNGNFNRQTNDSESAEQFEEWIFSNTPRSDSKIDSFFEKLDRRGRAQDRYGSVGGGSSRMMDDLEDSFDTLSDGMDGKLKNAAKYFEYDSEEVEKDDYAYRYDASLWPGTTYDVKELDLTKPGIRKPYPYEEFSVTTKEVLSQADFRNVRFLANFITEAGILHKRSKTGISAKAQRKVAREIKTARAFGLMPFTTMGTKSFNFGRSMENVEDDFAYENYDRNPRQEFDGEQDNH